MTKEAKSKLQTSKKLTYIIAIVWVLSVITSYGGVLLLDKDTSFILATVSSSFGFCITGYFTKSFLENKEIAKNELIATSQIIETESDFGIEPGESDLI